MQTDEVANNAFDIVRMPTTCATLLWQHSVLSAIFSLPQEIFPSVSPKYIHCAAQHTSHSSKLTVTNVNPQHIIVQPDEGTTTSSMALQTSLDQNYSLHKSETFIHHEQWSRMAGLKNPPRGSRLIRLVKLMYPCHCTHPTPALSIPRPDQMGCR